MATTTPTRVVRRGTEPAVSPTQWRAMWETTAPTSGKVEWSCQAQGLAGLVPHPGEVRVKNLTTGGSIAYGPLSGLWSPLVLPPIDVSAGDVVVLEARPTAGGQFYIEHATATVRQITPTDTQAPAISGGQSFVANQGDPNGTVIGTVAASDNVAVTGFAITAGNTGGAFAISSAGQLTIANSAAVTGGGFTLSVTASDAAGNTSAPTSVVISVAAPPTGAAFRRHRALSTPGTPPSLLEAIGATNTSIVRSELDGLLDAWVAGTGGATRVVTNDATWTSAMAAAQPGDLVRVTASFSTTFRLEARGTRYGISGASMTASPNGGTGALPIIVTCADGVSVGGTGLSSGNPVLDLANNRHVWAVGFNVSGNSQFGIRCMNWGGTAADPAYVAYCTVNQVRDASIIFQGWWQTIAASGGTPPAGDQNTYGFSEYFVAEENTITDPNPNGISGNPGEGIYCGRGSAPGWVGYVKFGWIRGNTVTGYKANGYECKPGCHHLYWTDNVAIAGRGQLGGAFEMCYQFNGIVSRPAYMNDIEGSGTGDIHIYVEGNRVYDFNITETGTSRNHMFILGMAGVRIANNMAWSLRNASGQFGPTDLFYASPRPDREVGQRLRRPDHDPHLGRQQQLPDPAHPVRDGHLGDRRAEQHRPSRLRRRRVHRHRQRLRRHDPGRRVARHRRPRPGERRARCRLGVHPRRRLVAHRGRYVDRRSRPPHRRRHPRPADPIQPEPRPLSGFVLTAPNHTQPGRTPQP